MNEKIGIIAMGNNFDSQIGGVMISIITVVKNGVKYIQQTIDSVVNQNYEKYEYIVIDGLSTDGTIEILERNINRIDYLVSEKDDGIYSAINKGISVARGDIIGIISSSDWYQDDNVFDLIAQKHRDNPLAILHGICKIYDENGQFIHVSGEPFTCLNDHMFPHPSTFVPKKIYDTYGYFDEKFKIAADYEAMLRYRGKGVDFSFLDNVIACFRIGGISSINDLTKIETDQIKEKYGLFRKVDDGFIRKYLKKIFYWILKVVEEKF